ncbi:MAG: aspartate aminotransferase [Candidatus Microgenomates bacterium]
MINLNNEINKNLKKAKLSAIKQIAYLAEEERKKGKNIVSLAVGIPFYPMPKYIKDEVVKKLFQKKDIDKYTYFSGITPLREKIAQIINNQLNIPTSPDEIILTAGSMMALKYAVNAIINPGDEVIVFSPYFPSYFDQVVMMGGKIIESPLKITVDKNQEKKYSLDLEKTEKLINKKTKAIIINNPHNPTGAVFSKEELMSLAKLIKKYNLYLITDEVYDFLFFDDTQYFNIASISWLWPKVIRCFSFSKKYGITGWRVGYLHANKNIIYHILKIHDATTVCINHLAQEAILTALSKNNNNEIINNINQLKINRQLMMNHLNELTNYFSYIKPLGAYYFFIKYHLPFKINNFDLAKKILYEAQVAVVPGLGFGKYGENHLRFSFAQNKDEINESFLRIKKWIKNTIEK